MEYQELHQEKYIVSTKRITLDTGKNTQREEGDEEKLARCGNGLSVRKQSPEALYIP